MYYDFILNKTGGDAEAAYYLLTKRLEKALRSVFENHGFGLSDDYDDTIADFFLYLYEGDPDGNGTPFSIMANVHNKSAFFGWVVGTYRNFLIKRAREEEKRKRLFSLISMEDTHPERLSDETMVSYLATAIAYADQEFTLRNRFVLYRLLLTFLDHAMAVPQEQIAKVIGMNPVTYRVNTKRQKERFMKLISDQEAGKPLWLDSLHRELRDHIIKGFASLYDVLLQYYELTVNELPLAMEIKALRKHYSGSDELMMHDAPPEYGFRYKLDIKQLYENLKIAWLSLEDTPPLPKTDRRPAPNPLPNNDPYAQ